MPLNVVEVREKPGFRFAVVTGTPADHSSWWSFDDEQEVRDRHWHPGPGETVMDVGAAFGSYTLPALAAGARVVAFNPAEFDTELLDYNLSLNPQLASRCLVVRCGLFSRNGWFDPDKNLFTADDQPIDVVSAPELFGMVGQRDDGGSKVDKSKLLRCRDLDSWMSEHAGMVACDWMKLDVEGAELEVLIGASKTLRRFHPKLLIELHEFHDKQMAGKVGALLTQFGYTCDGPYPHCAVSHAFYEVKA